MGGSTHTKPDQPSSPSTGKRWTDDETVDQTPPPDHDDWLATCASGRRATRRRWELRRRMKQEREAAEAREALQPTSEVDAPEPDADSLPPPDHAGWVEACANRLR